MEMIFFFSSSEVEDERINMKHSCEEYICTGAGLSD